MKNKTLNTIILLCIILIVGYILYFFYQKQQTRCRKEANVVEGFDDANAVKEADSIAITDDKYKMDTSNANDPTATGDKDMALKHFCIKGAANAGYSGGYVSTKMIENVISGGCRFLHFQVFSNEGNPVIGYTSDISTPTSTSTNTIDVPDAITTAISKGTTTGVPNYKDPLFIYLDVIAAKEKKLDIYGKLKNIISAIRDKPINKKINPNTSMFILNGKVVFIVNQEPEISALGGYANLTVGGNIIEHAYNEMDPTMYKAKPPKMVGKNKTNKTTFDVLVPQNNNSSQSNPNIFDSIGRYGVNVSLMQYYKEDNYLLNNELMFKHYNTGIVPMATAIGYTKIYGLEKKDAIKGPVFPKMMT
jgi:hypothetical protein